jgi:hypothetical protein
MACPARYTARALSYQNKAPVYLYQVLGAKCDSPMAAHTLYCRRSLCTNGTKHCWTAGLGCSMRQSWCLCLRCTTVSVSARRALPPLLCLTWLCTGIFWLPDGYPAPIFLTPRERTLSDQMVGYWINFGTRGSPGTVAGWVAFVFSLFFL